MGKNRGNPLPTMGEDVTGTTFDAEEASGITMNEPVGDYDELKDRSEPSLFNAVVGLLTQNNSSGLTVDEIRQHYDNGNDIIDVGEDRSVNYSWEDRGFITDGEWSNLKPYLQEELNDYVDDGLLYVEDGRYYINPLVEGMRSSDEIMEEAMDDFWAGFEG